MMLLFRKFIEKRKLINESKHLTLTAPHPSPLSAHRGFLGCKHFSKANAQLKIWGERTIDHINYTFTNSNTISCHRRRSSSGI